MLLPVSKSSTSLNRFIRIARSQRDLFPCFFPSKLQDCHPRTFQLSVCCLNANATFELCSEAHGKRSRVERLPVFANQPNWSEQKRGADKPCDSLRAMICKRIDSDTPPRAPVERRNFIKGKNMTPGMVTATVQIQNLRNLPRPAIVAHSFLIGLVCSKLYRLRSEKARGLMVPVPSMHAAPAIDYNVGSEVADEINHVIHCFVAPNFFRLLW